MRLKFSNKVIWGLCLVVMSGCDGRGVISGAVPTATANSLIGESRYSVIEKLGVPDAETASVMQYFMHGGGAYMVPAYASTTVIGNTVHARVTPSYVGKNCVWSFVLNGSGYVERWSKSGSNCATVY